MLQGSDRFIVDRQTGWIFVKYWTKVGEYKLEIVGQKGSLRPVCAVNVTIRDLPSEAIANSAAIQFYDVLDTSQFLNPIKNSRTNGFDSISYYERFVNMLAGIFDVPTDNVYVFSVQLANQTKLGKDYPVIEVHFAVRKKSTAKGPFLPHSVLINTIEKNNKTIKTIGEWLGGPVRQVGTSYSQPPPCRLLFIPYFIRVTFFLGHAVVPILDFFNV